jgi:hypothetical protein
VSNPFFSFYSIFYVLGYSWVEFAPLF